MDKNHLAIYIILFFANISKTTKAFFAYEENPEQGKVACPAIKDIYPCTCKYDLEEDVLDLDCSNITNEEDLFRIFYNEFHYTTFRRFEIYNNINLTRIPEGVFDQVTFEEIHIIASSITTLEPNAFINSASTLNILNLNTNSISYFPFEILGFYESLEELILYNNFISKIPTIRIPLLRILILDSNAISEISPDAFQHLYYLEEISMSDTGLVNMPAGLLMSNPYLRKVNLRNNELEKIVALTILLMHPDAEIIDLKYSSTQFLELDAIIIDGPKSLFIDMAHTKIKNLEEYVWQPILEQNATINFEACDLECGCTSQWLPAREEFHPLVIEAWCYDGWLPALTKDDFIMRNKVNCTIVL